MTLFLNKSDHEWVEYNEYLPCAQLTLSANLNSYAMKCNFCDVICLRLRVFIEHILEEHEETVAKMYNSNERSEEFNYEHEHLESLKAEHQEEYIADGYCEILESVEGEPDEPNRHEVLIERVDDSNIHTTYEIEALDCEYITYDDETNDQDDTHAYKAENIDDNDDDDHCDDDDEVDGDIESQDYNYKGCSKNNTDTSGTDDNTDDDSIGDHVADSTTSDRKKPRRSVSIDVHDETQRDLLVYIIRAHRDNPPLWDTNNVKFSNSRFKDCILKHIAGQIQNDFQQNITSSEVRKIFSALRSLYNKRLNRRYKDDRKLWFFHEISFLNKVKNRSDLTLPESSNLIIANVYKEFPALWNLKDKEYRDTALKDASFYEMLAKVNTELSRDVSAHQLNLSIRRLRRNFIANRRALLSHKQKKTQYTPPYPEYVDKLSYLNGHVGPFLCVECKAVTLNYMHHVAHMNVHAGLPNNACEYCGKNLKNPTNLKIHRRIHTRELPYECKTCGRKFSNSGTLRVHERVHTGDRPYICEVCGKRFRTCSFLLRHRMYHNKDNFRFKCDICDRLFGEKQRLHEHMNSHLDRREFLCNTCGKGFYARKTLRQHEQLHSANKKHECEICGLTFAQRSGMHAHMRRTHRKMALNASEA